MNVADRSGGQRGGGQGSPGTEGGCGCVSLVSQLGQLQTPQAVTDAAQMSRDALLSGGSREPITPIFAALHKEWEHHEDSKRRRCDVTESDADKQAGCVVETLRKCRFHLYLLAIGLAASAYHDREAHTAFRLLMDKIAETQDEKQIAWCARTWLRHAMGRPSVTPQEEKDLSDLLLAECAPRRETLLKDTAFMDLLVSEWLLKRRLDLATAWRCEMLEFLTKVALSPFLDWPLLLVVLGAMVVGAFICPWMMLGVAFAWCLLVALSPHFGRVLAPRLLASVLVGWLALSTTGWAWEFASQGEHGLTCFVADAVLCGLCFAYLLLGEVQRHVGRTDLLRSSRIWLVGALHALATGVVGFVVVGGVVDAARGTHWLDPLFSSSLTILKLSPFALTIGLLTQTLWQREAVTEPL